MPTSAASEHSNGFSDYAIKSYGNGPVANAKGMEQADAMKAFVKATASGLIEVMADTQAGAAAIKTGEPLANEAIEHERLELIVDGSMRTAGTRSNGWGAATPERLQATIVETVDAFGLESTPTVEAIWTDRFLPPAADRKLKT